MSTPLFASRWTKGLLLLFTLGVAAAAAIDTLANHWRVAKPDLALRLRPNDAVALSLVGDKRVVEEPNVTSEQAVAVASAARRALRSAPLTAPALRQIAAAEMMARRPVQARQLMLLAHDVSRREIGTLVWLIEDSLSRGDVKALLAYCDEALVANPFARDVIIPALSAGLFDPVMRSGLTPLLQKGRPWMPYLLRHALNSSEDGVYVAPLVLHAGGLPLQNDVYFGLNGQILGFLVAHVDFEQARAYLRRMGGTSHDIGRDIRFPSSSSKTDSGPFAWQVEDVADIGGELDYQGNAQLRSAADQRGVVARRVLMLPPGTYRFNQTITVPAGSPAASVRWEMRCLSTKGNPLTWGEEFPTKNSKTTYTSFIEIPDNCPGQQFALIAGSNDGSGESQAVVGDLALTKR